MRRLTWPLAAALALTLVPAAAAQDADDVDDVEEFRLTYVATRLTFGGAREVVTQGREVQVNLDADVLFDVDSSELTGDARELLERTAGELDDAASGTVARPGRVSSSARPVSRLSSSP